eukprot:TRINITY_DN50581_c0_g1_i1.p1 TRINITY_DN50581_c0_g1~~TRINITY_DN50581_c0_g1_i1.p1  ORF type:complete len:329 (-),score=63.50 TRINITY_DN50581_c0_g1_i1:70-1002(-)
MQKFLEQRLPPLRQVFLDEVKQGSASERLDRRHTFGGYIPHALVEKYGSVDFKRDEFQRKESKACDGLCQKSTPSAETCRHSIDSVAARASAASTPATTPCDASGTSFDSGNGPPSTDDTCSDNRAASQEEPRHSTGRANGKAPTGCGLEPAEEVSRALSATSPSSVVVATARQLAERTRQAVLARRQRQQQRCIGAVHDHVEAAAPTEMPRLLCRRARVGFLNASTACDDGSVPSPRARLLGRVSLPGNSGNRTEFGRIHPSPEAPASGCAEGEEGLSPTAVAARGTREAFLARAGRRKASRDFSDFAV